MKRSIPALFALALTFFASSAMADASRLEVKGFEATSADGSRVTVAVYLFKPGQRQESHEVSIDFVGPGGGRTVLWSGNARFSGARGGFRHSVTVDVSGRDLARGHLEATATECASSSACKKRLEIRKGDLQLAAAPEVEQRGNQSALKLRIKNAGPIVQPACRVVLQVEGRNVATQNIGRLGSTRTQEVSLNYPANLRDKNYKIKLDCADLATNNNERTGRLR